MINPVRMEIIFLEAIIVFSLFMKYIKLKIRKAPKGFQNPSGAYVVIPFRYALSYITPQGYWEHVVG